MSALGWLAALLLTIVVVALNLLFYGALAAVVLWVALTLLQHFGVLMLGIGVLA